MNNDSNNPVNDDRDPTIPGNILITGIMDTVKEVLEGEAIFKEIKALSEKLGVESADNILNIMVASTVHSVFKSITLYDTLLKEELTVQFDRYGTILNNLGADTDVIKVKMHSLEKKMGEFTTKLGGEMDELRTMVECEELNNLSDRVVNLEIYINHMENEFAVLKKKLSTIRSMMS
jgi:hypothetical protein